MRKKIIAIILTVAMVLSLAIPASTTVTEPKASIQDALDILKFLAKLDSPVTGNATIEDALDILKYLARLDSVIGGQIPVRVPQPVVTTPVTNPVTPALTPGQFTEFAPAVMDFSLDVLRRSFAEDTGINTLVSPLSVLLALTMTANGAVGQTLAEMEAVLGRGIRLDDLNEMLKAYVNNLPSAESSSLNIANSIWYDDERFTVIEEFLEFNKKHFNAQIISADFDDPNVIEQINDWVSEKTEEMITQIIEEIDVDTLMYLINAIAFDAEWAVKYDDSAVRKRDFNTADGRKQNVDFLWSLESQLIEMDNAIGFVKPYKGNHYSFAAILPDEGIEIADFIAGMTAESFARAVSSPKSTYGGVSAALPKFSFEYDISMVDVLSAMGMPTAFSRMGANFRRLGLPKPPHDNIFVSDVIHKTFIEVDQVGTRAGAVTAVIMAGADSVPPPPVPVILDRPFVFAIMDNSTDLPIFIGTLLEID
jgi:serpin B